MIRFLLGMGALLLAVPLAAAVPTASADEPDAGTTSETVAATAQRPTADRKKRRFPTARNTGVPRKWTPRRTVHGDYVVRRKGAVVRNLRIINGDLLVAAPNVRIHRVLLRGGVINNAPAGRCFNGLRITRTKVTRSGATTRASDEPAIGPGGYVARRVEINNVPEGFRVGGRSMGCNRVRIVNSYARVVAPDECDDWHGDGIQGYNGPRLVVRNTTVHLVERRGCHGTAPFFYPHSQGNRSADVERLLVSGGGLSFRMGTRGRVAGLKIARGSWGYGPIDVRCSALSRWKAKTVRINKKGQPFKSRRKRCTTNSGG